VIVVGGQRQDDVELPDIELPITIHVEHEAFGGGIEAGTQRGPIAAVLRVVLRPQAWKLRLQAVQNLTCPVAAPVVDDQQLVVEPRSLEIRHAVADDAFDIGLLIESGKHDRQLPDHSDIQFAFRSVHHTILTRTPWLL
jgi:hypothetical protein